MQPSVMQMAGHTLSVIEAARRSARLLNPAASQSFMSFVALALKAIEVIFSSSLREPEPFRAPAREAELTAEQTCAIQRKNRKNKCPRELCGR